MLKKKRKLKRYFIERSIELLEFCYQQYFLTREQIKSWYRLKYNIKNENTLKTFVSNSLWYFHDENLIEVHRFPRLNNFEEIFFVSQKGTSFLKEFMIPEFSFYEKFDPVKFKHNRIATEIRMELESMYDIEDWYSDREIEVAEEHHFPDALFIYSFPFTYEDLKIAIEVELHQKSRSRYYDKFRYYQIKSYDFLIYFVPKKSIKDMVLETSDTVGTIVYVALIDEFSKLKRDATLESSNGDVLAFKNIF